WSATSGGKDRLAAGPGLVAESRQSLVAVSLGPFSDIAHAQAAGRGGLLQSRPSLEQQQEAAAAGQARGGCPRTQPPLGVRSIRRGQGDDQGGFAAKDGDTRGSGVRDGDSSS